MLKLIVGLGNPGKEYQTTYHNIGFIFLDLLEKKYPDLKYLKPENYMNNSGQEVAKTANYFKISPENILVVHDDLDIPLGEYRLQFDKSSAGHNGIKSIIESLQTQAFWRLRIGIGKPQNIPPESYVLQKITTKNMVVLKNLFAIILADQNFIEHLGH